ncbi:50S ribosomal protein L18 [Candidatus Curtissbacteria bacterium]|nr:50S ribosomal protein L18 [Candidatus Curtissbacteria bacterium]
MRVKKVQRIVRHRRLRKKISGTGNVPRLSVFRSNKHIYAQLIDDSQMRTMVAFSDSNLPKTKSKVDTRLSKIEEAYQVGINLAKRASARKIKKVVFDRGGQSYHGRVKALAEGARSGGLIF